ncbi:MAG: sensor histidine kinase [Candidatus Binatia bacterium]
MLGLVLASIPFFIGGFVALLDPPVDRGFLFALLAVLIAGNAGILELPPYRFLHMTTGMIVFGAFFIAGPAVLALLAVSLKPSELLVRWIRGLSSPGGHPRLGGTPKEYAVPATAVGVVLGIVDALRGPLGLSYPFRPADAGSEVHLFLVLAPIYFAFIFLTELGTVLRFGFGRVLGNKRALEDLVVYLLAILLGAPVVSAIARFYAPDLLHSLYSLGWMVWSFGVFAVAQILVGRSLMIERLVTARRKQERLAALGRLASVIAHQTRHHLGVLNMSAYVLGETLARESLSAQAREAVASELAAIARTRDELDALLAQELRGGGHEERFGVLALARECGGDLAPLAEGRSVEVTYGGQEHRVRGDRLRLKQAITNVIRNAIEATPEGSRVTIELGAEDSQVRLTVSDQGPGLSPSAKSHLFEPLFTDKSDGLGMGLYVARAIVEAHGGNIDLRSTDGGTRAEIALWSSQVS